MFEPPIPMPVTDRPEVRALCERLVPGGVPDVLNVERVPGAMNDDCFANVQRLVDEFGGTIQYGWQLWEALPGVLIEAEAHAVYVDRDGNYRDVTPKPLPSITQTVFLADPSMRYEGRQIDNVRVSLVDDPLVTELIDVAERYFEATNRGALADYYGPMNDIIRKDPQLREFHRRKEQLEIKIVFKYFFSKTR